MFSVIRRSIPQIYKKVEECVQMKLSSNVMPTATAWPITYSNGYNLQSLRHKSKKSQKQPTKNESGSESESSGGEDHINMNTKVMRATVASLRADLLLKVGMGIGRSKVETLFYDSKIRVNGQKLLKKSSEIAEGDEIDVVRGPAGENADLLSVSRVEIVSITQKTDSYVVKLRRCKDLTIENYDK